MKSSLTAIFLLSSGTLAQHVPGVKPTHVDIEPLETLAQTVSLPSSDATTIPIVTVTETVTPDVSSRSDARSTTSHNVTRALRTSRTTQDVQIEASTENPMVLVITKTETVPYTPHLKKAVLSKRSNFTNLPVVERHICTTTNYSPCHHSKKSSAETTSYYSTVRTTVSPCKSDRFSTLGTRTTMPVYTATEYGHYKSSKCHSSKCDAKHSCGNKGHKDTTICPTPTIYTYQQSSVSQYHHKAPVSEYHHKAPVSEYHHKAPVSEYHHKAPVSEYHHKAPISEYSSKQSVSTYYSKPSVSTYYSKPSVSLYYSKPTSSPYYSMSTYYQKHQRRSLALPSPTNEPFSADMTHRDTSARAKNDFQEFPTPKRVSPFLPRLHARPPPFWIEPMM